MVNMALYGVAVCALWGVGLVRRAGRAEELPKHYAFDAPQGAGIISEILVRNGLVKIAPEVEQEEIPVDNTGSINPESLEALKVPLQALIEGAVEVTGRRFRTCSEVEAFVLPDFNETYLVVNDENIVVGYFDAKQTIAAG